MATHSSVLAWRIPGTWEPGGLPSMGSYRVGHDCSNLAAAAAAAVPYSQSFLLVILFSWTQTLLLGYKFSLAHVFRVDTNLSSSLQNSITGSPWCFRLLLGWYLRTWTSLSLPHVQSLWLTLQSLKIVYSDSNLNHGFPGRGTASVTTL